MAPCRLAAQVTPCHTCGSAWPSKMMPANLITIEKKSGNHLPHSDKCFYSTLSLSRQKQPEPPRRSLACPGRVDGAARACRCNGEKHMPRVATANFSLAVEQARGLSGREPAPRVHGRTGCPIGGASAGHGVGGLHRLAKSRAAQAQAAVVALSSQHAPRYQRPAFSRQCEANTELVTIADYKSRAKMKPVIAKNACATALTWPRSI